MATTTTERRRKPAESNAATGGTLSAEELRKMDAYWRASNHLSVGQIYLLDNLLLKEPLKREHIFAFHGYPWLIHRLTYRRTNHGNLHVRGYQEEGATTTPFDMVAVNDLDRFLLVEAVIDRLPQRGAKAAYFKQAIHEKLIEHKNYIAEHGDDMPAIAGWKWGLKGAAPTNTSTAGDNV